jgi:hypothetical protein
MDELRPDARRAARLLYDAANDMDLMGAHDKAQAFRERAAIAEADADRDLTQYLYGRRDETPCAPTGLDVM